MNPANVHDRILAREYEARAAGADRRRVVGDRQRARPATDVEE